MNKVIDGRRYNTDTAKYLATWDNGKYPDDFSYVQEDLYVKRTGEYFVAVTGGANTRYCSHNSDGTRSRGFAAIPMTEAEARIWCETHCSADTYIRIWGTPDE